MAATLDEIGTDLAQWISEQPLFFVATAPSGSAGHVNLSPKGLASLAVLGPRRVAYLDLTGSTDEFANLALVCPIGAAAAAPTSARHNGEAHADATMETVSRISTSCGFGVPLMEMVSARDNLTGWAERKGHDGLVEYRENRNAESIDGLAGFPAIGS
jgi:hypothetical protein